MTPPDSCKTGDQTAVPDSSPASAQSKPLPDGWNCTGYDEIGNAAGYRIAKNYVNTFAFNRPVYYACTPVRGFLGAFPERDDAIAACDRFAQHATGA